jgi:preprotein translocase subunit SecG
MTHWDSSHRAAITVDECAASAYDAGAAVNDRQSMEVDAPRPSRDRHLRINFSLVVAVVLAMLLVLAASLLQSPSQAYADESPSSTSSSSASSSESASSDGEMTVSDSITDTQNLLGSQASLVNDTITKTKSETGVTVRLLYLSTFSGNSNPEKWTSTVLESTDPPANTVLLAVASQDGNLVVAVSANSEAWLKQQSTVDELSDAALKPITEGDTPDWATSAIDMMSSIEQIKQTSTDATAQHVGVSVFVAVLVILVIAAVVMFVLHQRRKSVEGSSQRSKRRSRHDRQTGGDSGDSSKEYEHAQGDALSHDKGHIRGRKSTRRSRRRSERRDRGTLRKAGADTVQDTIQDKQDYDSQAGDSSDAMEAKGPSTRRGSRSDRRMRRAKRTRQNSAREDSFVGNHQDSNNNSDGIQETPSQSGQAIRHD